jgi:hypothetical protein
VLRSWFLSLVLVLGLVAACLATARPVSAQTTTDPRFFEETGFRIDNDAFWAYFSQRGGVRTFGYPVSRDFPLLGFDVQIFQRVVLQRQPDGSVRTLNLLDEGLLPYTQLNGSVFPAPDPALVKATPSPGDPQYADKILRFVQDQAVDTFEGEPVHFGQTFASTVTAQDAFPTGQGEPALLPLMDLELWGAPTSKPARDPHNPNFIYQRFQRGIMHYDKGCGCTQGLLLADYFKALLVGENVPPDLAAQARESRFFKQYDRHKAHGLVRPNDLPRTDLSQAFDKQAAVIPQVQAAPQPAPPPAPVWMQASQQTTLWSGPNDQAIQFGSGAPGDYYQVTGPAQGGRVPVIVARTNGPAWVEVAALKPSEPPPAGWPPPPPPPPLGWVATLADVPLSADAAGKLPLGLAPAGTALKQLEVQQGPRLHVQDPITGGSAWVEATSVGPVGPPEGRPVPSRWWGKVVVDGANLRAGPSTGAALLGTLPTGSPVVVSAWVAGEEVVKDNVTWAKLADGAYLYSTTLRPVALPAAPPPPAAAAGRTGKWIDLNLTQQVVVAYEGQTVVHMARTSTGRPGWETSTGVFSIQRRVEKETMDSSTLLGLDAARADYKVENVRWTQYFTADGMALHENYWKPPDTFGIPSSHGCAGLVAADAKFFWDWASVGTPVYAHR